MSNDEPDRKANEAVFWDQHAGGGSGFRGTSFYWHVNEQLWSITLGQLGDLAGRKVLLVGCGISSLLVKDLASRGGEVWCLDISPASIELLMSHPFGPELLLRIHPAVGDAENMPFETGFFDVAIGRAIVHHLNIEKFMTEIRRVCKPGAKIAFAEPLGVNPAINLFRWLTPSSRVATEHPLKPADVRLIRSYCQSLEARYTFLLALLSAPWFMMRLSRVGYAFFRVGRAIDQVLFRVLPPTKWLAWNVTLTGSLNDNEKMLKN